MMERKEKKKGIEEERYGKRDNERGKEAITRSSSAAAS